MPETATETRADAPTDLGLGDVAGRLVGPAPPPPPPTSPALSFAERLQGLETTQARARAAERKATETLKPSREAELAELRRSLPPPPEAPTTAPPPSRGLHAFLAPVEGESPETSITKAVQALSLFGTMWAGGKMGARSSLAALTGAMEGWREGDRERADRAFADWQAHTGKVLNDYKTQRDRWTDLIATTKLNAEQRARAIDIEAVMAGDEALHARAEAGDQAGILDIIAKRDQAAATLQLGYTRLLEARARANQHADLMRELQKERLDFQRQQQIELEKSYTPDMLRIDGQNWAMSGQLPPRIGYGRTGQIISAKIKKAGIEWAKEQGIDLSTLPVVRAEVAATRSALTKLSGANAIQGASIRRLDGHLDKLVELGTKVPRTEMPVANQYILKGRRDYQGDPATAAYILQALEVGMEFARTMVGTAQGDAASREEARAGFASELAQGQLEEVVKTVRNNAHRNLEMNRASERALMDIIASAGERVPTSPAPGTSPTMRIRRKGEAGGKLYEGPRGAVPEGYEEIP